MSKFTMIESHFLRLFKAFLFLCKRAERSNALGSQYSLLCYAGLRSSHHAIRDKNCRMSRRRHGINGTSEDAATTVRPNIREQQEQYYQSISIHNLKTMV